MGMIYLMILHIVVTFLLEKHKKSFKFNGLCVAFLFDGYFMDAPIKPALPPELSVLTPGAWYAYPRS